MKVKEWFKKFLAGMGIGVGAAIPGVSGAAVAVIFKVYEDIIWAVNHFFKHFLRALAILIPVLLGIICAVIPCIWAFKYALEAFYFGLICIFAGFLVGSFPGITDEVKGVKIERKQIIEIIIGALVVIAMGVASALLGDKINVDGLFQDSPWWFYIILLFVGIIAAIALTVPGLSGSLILLILGFYTPLVTNTVDWTKEVFTNGSMMHLGKLALMLGVFAIGVLIGIVIVSKIMKVLLEKHHNSTYFSIIGFVGGSIAVLFFNWNSIAYYNTWAGVASYEKVNPVLPIWLEILIGLVLLAICGFGAYMLTRRSRQIKEKEATNNGVGD